MNRLEIKALKQKVEELNKANRRLSQELIDTKAINSKQAHFLDELEILLDKYGFKVVNNES